MVSRHAARALLTAGIGDLLVLAMVATPGMPAWADDALDAKQLVERSALTVESFAADPNYQGTWRDLMKDAKGILVSPQVVKAGFIFGGSGGSLVFLVRDEKTRGWTGPAFYTVGGISFGLLAGAEAAELVIVVRTERGVTRLLSSSAKLGGDLSVAAGPVGAGVGAAGFTADLIILSRAKGLYGGMSLEGSVLAVRDSLNEAYYGKPATPSDILIRGTVKNPEAMRLLEVVQKLAGP